MCQGQIEPNHFYLTIFLPLVCSAGPEVRPVGSTVPQFCAQFEGSRPDDRILRFAKRGSGRYRGGWRNAPAS